MSTFIQIVCVMLILMAMLMLLMGMRHLFYGHIEHEQEDIKTLRHEVESECDVISDRNMFHDLVSGKHFHEKNPDNIEVEYIRVHPTKPSNNI